MKVGMQQFQTSQEEREELEEMEEEMEEEEEEQEEEQETKSLQSNLAMRFERLELRHRIRALWRRFVRVLVSGLDEHFGWKMSLGLFALSVKICPLPVY